MNCELIFYLSNRTSLCEKALKAAAGALDLKFRDAKYATSPENYGSLIIDAFENVNVVFSVGGITGDKNGVENVLSKALANKSPDDLKKLRNPLSKTDGYLVRQGGQLLVVLPDEPAELEAVFAESLVPYLNSFLES